MLFQVGKKYKKLLFDSLTISYTFDHNEALQIDDKKNSWKKINCVKTILFANLNVSIRCMLYIDAEYKKLSFAFKYYLILFFNPDNALNYYCNRLKFIYYN